MSSHKIARDLKNRVRAAVGDEPIGVIVRHQPGTFSAHTLRSDAYVIHRFQLVSATAMRVPMAEIEALSRDDSVEYIWPDLPVHTCLDESVPHVSAPLVWGKGYLGEGIKIAVLDTGIDGDHPDFRGRIMGVTSLVGGDGIDDNGHGTHVAGIIAGSGTASGGRYRGVAPAAKLYSAKVLDARGGGAMSDVMAGIEWAVEQGVQIINMSLGGDDASDGTDALSTLCDQVVRQMGIVICVAAGNAGPTVSTVGSPGCARWVITVGATDNEDHVQPFSSRGPTSDGRVKPDIVFPGARIISTRASGTELGRVIEPQYVEMSGTSMATPFASGSAALLLEAMPDLKPHKIKQALVGTAVQLDASPNAQGSGRGDVFKAYHKITSPQKVRSFSRTQIPGSRGTKTGWLTGVLRTLGLR